jgi:hypothetical protein
MPFFAELVYVAKELPAHFYLAIMFTFGEDFPELELYVLLDQS